MAAALAATLIGCTSVPPVATASPATLPPIESLMPRLGGDPAAFDALDADEVRQHRLVATNLVSALLQLPETRPETSLLQALPPSTAFGNTTLRALEDAGYAVQYVGSDVGPAYVDYSRRVGETSTGTVLEYQLSVGEVVLSREYAIEDGAIFPASLVRLRGSSMKRELELSDALFVEQGASSARAFVSGTRDLDGTGADTDARTIEVRSFDRVAADRRTDPGATLAEAARAALLRDSVTDAPDLDDYVEYRRTVLVLDSPDATRLGQANKRAVRALVQRVRPGDLVQVTACQDADGVDARSAVRGALVERELISHGLDFDDIWQAPCTRTSYRFPGDDSPVPVDLVVLRPAGR